MSSDSADLTASAAAPVAAASAASTAVVSSRERVTARLQVSAPGHDVTSWMVRAPARPRPSPTSAACSAVKLASGTKRKTRFCSFDKRTVPSENWRASRAVPRSCAEVMSPRSRRAMTA